MHLLILEPQNPLDLLPEEVRDLADSIAKLDPDYDVRVAGKGFAAPAVTLVEVLYVWLPGALMAAGPVIVPRILDLCIKWAQNRLKKDPARRPRSIDILGPDGMVIRSVRVKGASGEIEDRTSLGDSTRPPRSRPPIS